MKVTIDVDLTPEEMRRLIGFPDVQQFNEAVMEEMLLRLKAGTEGYDPLQFFRAGIMGNTDTWTKWTELFSPFGSKTAKPQ
ncbi:DUF6489 family protein [Thiofilum flexile]|uniref:DUF6489 family protein n=1 Tax=Thiofilum flexile TaxID=125627 RepID=UPI0003645FA0|nr:DUF6489 family protein [Thiofilum flexile]